MLTVVTPPATYPLSWDDDVASHIRVSTEEERSRVEGILIPGVDQYARNKTNLSLITQTLKLTLDAFPCGSDGIELPRAPLLTITSLKYYDSTGTLTTVATTEYVVETGTPTNDGAPTPGVLRLAYDKSWPTPRTQRGAVEITYTAGYGPTAATVPALLKAGMLMLLGEMYERREESIVGSSVTPNVIRANDIFRMFRVPKYAEGWAA